MVENPHIEIFYLKNDIWKLPFFLLECNQNFGHFIIGKIAFFATSPQSTACVTNESN